MPCVVQRPTPEGSGCMPGGASYLKVTIIVYHIINQTRRRESVGPLAVPGGRPFPCSDSSSRRVHVEVFGIHQVIIRFRHGCVSVVISISRQEASSVARGRPYASRRDRAFCKAFGPGGGGDRYPLHCGREAGRMRGSSITRQAYGLETQSFVCVQRYCMPTSPSGATEHRLHVCLSFFLVVIYDAT